MSPIMARSAGICLAALLIMLAATAPASGACTMSVSRIGTASDANGVFVLNDKVYIASTNGHYIIMPLSSLVATSDFNIGGSPYDVFVSGSTAYLTDFYSSNGVRVVNADTGAPLGECTNWPSGLSAIGIYNSGSYAYVGATDYTNGYLVVLSLTTPNSPSVVNTISSGPMAQGGGGLCVTDGKIYLATDNGVDEFTLGNPASPSYSGTISTPYGAYDVHVFGTNAYVVMGTNPPSGQPNVVVLDLANSGTQTDCYYDSTPSYALPPYAIQFYNGKIYIVDPNGLKELSVGSVSGSLTVNLDAVPNNAQDFTFSGDLGSFILDDDSDDTYPSTKTFSSLAAGYYAFHQTVPSGWIVSSITASDASKVTYSSDGNSWHSTFTSGDTWAKASVQAGGSTLTVNFQDTRVYSISGHVIYDLDGNGAKNNFEGYVPNGWVVQLWKDGTQTSQTTTLSGAYSFSNLPAGNYEVRSILQTGWVNTIPATGIRSYSPLSSDQTNQDFGVRGSQSIAGMKFHDLDGDRAKDAGEPGLASWTIDLKKDGNKIASTQTAAGGAYSFAGLAPGSYTVEETLQSGWIQSYPASPGTHAVTLVAGVAGPTDKDFGNYQTTGFSGVKFEDLNGNGAKDAGEPGISGWTIKLKQGATEIASTQTGTVGAYSFTGIAPGSYTVEEVAQSGWTQSYPATPGTYPLTLVSGVAGPTDINFGNLRSTGFSGVKFEDLNGNGAKDAGEPGLSGWTIKLKQGATEIASTQTGTVGAYSFTGIAPGSYTVEEVAQSGWTQSYPATPGTYPLTLVSGVAGPTDINFGNWRATGFSGMKFEDLNGNGAKDAGEPGISGWTIKLKQGATEITSIQTGTGGAYSFTGIAPGSYTVEEVAQSGWTRSYPASPGTHSLTLVSGVAGPTNIDFGNWKSTGLSGVKFEDLNGNGAKDTGEPGISGWTIKLMSGATEIASTQTGAGGAYSFAGISPGSYTVKEEVESGWTQSYPATPGTYPLNLVSGVAGPTNIDFGNWKSTGLSGVKFEDLNGNGAKDTGEPGISGWTIKLMSGATEISSTQTGADGSYSFAGIAPGSYTVTEAMQPGWTQSYPATPGTYPLTLISGVAGPANINFGNWRTTGLSGMKFEDLNGNGAKDAGEPGISGWTIKLMSDATEIASTQTGADGSYSFTGIAPGSYTIEEVAQGGWTQSYPATPGTYPLTLISGVAGPTNINFGNWRTTVFSGMKFEDLNGNGAKDAGEPGLKDWTIKLMNGATEISSTQTGADGAYSFTDIAPGSYTVEEAMQAGWARTYPASPGTHTINLVSGVAGPTNINFGNARATGFSGMKFEDLNGNGAKDLGEPGLEGWTIKLMSGATEIASTQTDADGAYSFTDISPGSYTVKEEVKSGWTQSYPATPGTYPLTLISGVAGPTNIDFGNWKSTGLSGVKFEDLNGNGAKDTGEPGISGWTIKLMSGATEIAGTQTGADGAYSFTDIAPGSYTVEETAQAGWTQSYPATPGTYPLTLVSGVAGPNNIDFGNWRTTGLSGMKFGDLNGNGAKDAGEPGLKDWTIKLMSGATEIASTQTGADGAYSFTGIAPGSYTVEEVAQSGWTQSYPAAPGTYPVTLSSGLLAANIDFGNWKATGFTGLKFEDLNGNGAKDAGEPGLEGWTIKLMSGATEISSTQTDADGAYSFTDIAPGSYTVEEAMQAGWAQTCPASPGTHTINLVSGVAGPTNINFGNARGTGFSGMKFEDLNGNGAKDAGETGLEGWTIKLMSGATEIASTQTDADGSYSFIGITPGSYTVQEEAQAGWTQSYPATPGTYPLNLVSGVAGPTNIDFGNWKATGLSGVKFEDLNGNGAKDTGEPGLTGWTIKLMSGATEIASTQTNVDGAYSFTGIAPGSYTVTEAMQPGWTQSYPATPGTYPLTLVSGVAGPTNINFGNWRTTGLSGMKFEDLNGNGAKDAGEPGISGWTIKLMSDATEIASTQTGADGSYSFTGIAPGSYTVEEVAQSGWTQSYPATPGTYPLTLISGVAGPTDINFGNWRTTGFSGMKFEDLNGNGARDAGEPGLKDWTIKLMNGATEISSIQTGADGAYSFTDIAPGSYTVEEAMQAGWARTYPASPGTHTINLVSGVAGPTNINFGNARATGFSGMKFEDLNGNGAKDAGEPGLEGWTIKLMSGATEISSTQTDADGAYSFTDISPGSYTVKEEVKSGWTQSYPATPGTYPLNLVSGVAGPTNIDFGNWKATGLSGVKFEDLNGNGAKDAGETGISGWTIKLKQGTTEISSTQTGTGGAYSFTGIAPGSYTVEEVAQIGWTQSYPASPGTHSFTLVSGVAGPTNIDFGNWRTTGLSGMKFEDLNGNGAKDAGEPGLKDWTIKLMSGATEIASTQTGADGSYSFTGIAPGSYTIEEVAQGGWTQSYPAAPGTHSLALASGVAGPTDINFGNWRTTGLSGMKFEDLNGNGARDAGEPGLKDWTIKLMSGATEISSTQTDADGAYSFTDIAPGSYTVVEAMQAGWAQTYPVSPGTHSINLVSGVAGPTNINFGNDRATGFSGMKFEDLNGNGAKDAGEPGLEGWTIKLMSGATEIASTQTDADGAYSFTDIAPGSYTVKEEVKSGWTQSYPATSGTYPLTLVSGVAGPTNIDFGNWKSTGLSGVKFEDLNGNGAKDVGEPSLEGWTIKLMSGATEISSTQTDADGAYSFIDIAPGSYTVKEEVKSGWTQSYPASPGTHAITLVSGLPVTNIDFGNWKSTGFSGVKFEDNNGNGAKDAGEPGLKDWTIKLMKGTTVVSVIPTDADGAYSFTDIAPGSYTVEEAAQAGWTQSYPASPGMQTVNLVSGVIGPKNVDFGNWRSTGFSGMKFEDLNGNGAKDSGEPGLFGWAIVLKKGETVVSVTQTDPDGVYSFADIAPGSYTVEEAMQSGWTQTNPIWPGTHSVTLVSGIAGPNNIDFGNARTTGFSGLKFEDLNGNGAKDAGEPGLKDWTIKLMSGATEISSTQTAADGSYSFIGITPGSYTVQEEAQAGWTQSYPATPGTYPLTLVSGVAGPTDIDFGNWKSTGFSGMKFEDLNGNGAKDAGEPGLKDWTIKLMSGATEISSTQTAADGSYSFIGITPGSYTVQEVAQAGWTQSYPASPGTHAITLVSGVAGPTDLDFGNWKSTGFSGLKFEDLNGNGAKDAGEPGLADWTIRIMKGATVVASALTLADGAYSFTGIAPGSYIVEETAQAGWTQSYPASPGTQTVNLVSGAAGPNDIDFGNWRATGFSGMKFNDLDRNGARDAGEPGLSGWTIKLMKGATETSSTQTAADGSYSFTDIAPGSYTVQEAAQSGWVQSYPATPGMHPITLVSGIAGPTDIDFGNRGSLAISGMKFHDKNANGIQDDGEPGLSGWDIQLKDSSDNLLQTATTSAEPGKEGVYEFADLPPGTYRVYEAPKTGWVRTAPAEDHYVITLTDSSSRGNLFGNNQLAISGMKFHDKNANGIKDDGEPGLSGWQIQLKDGSDNLLQTVTTSSDPGKEGVYEFLDLQPGTYHVYEIQQDGWIRTAPDQEYHSVTLSNMPSRGNMFGNNLVNLSGTKFEDLNGNGAKDSGEPGLAGWTIRLIKEGTEISSTFTDADGSYSFARIAPGSYSVVEDVKDGWTQSYPPSGKHTFSLAFGEFGRSGLNFGNFRPTGFAGTKFEDLNGNGAKDSGEPGLSGWTIRLMKEGALVSSTVTAADGSYSFTGISPGSYTVEESAQSGWTQSYPATPGTHEITLVSGVAGPINIDFGNYWSTGLSGMKFDDKNGNGAKDSGEPGLEGWTIKLMSGATEVASTVTAADGSYSFTNIVPGEYTVEEVLQSGWLQTYPTAPGTHAVILVSGVAGRTDLDFGNWKTTGLSGVKFEDLNANGAKDSGEPGIAGWTIKLMNGATEVAGTVTAADGSYSFAGVVPGSYTVQEDAQAAWTQSYPASPGTYPVTLVSGVDGPKDLDFGNWRKTSLSGMKFDDINGNGVKDSGEPGIAGWTIVLKKDGAQVDRKVTNSDGAYSFADIVPGRYTVEEEAQDGWLQTRPASPGVYSLDLLSGIAASNIDFGNYWSTGLSGMKFEDKNGNGAKDSGEPGLSGWTIRLMKDGTEVASTVTAADGSYSFTNIVPGEYKVEEVLQSGWLQTYPAAPGTHAVILVSGVAGPTNLDFGNWKTTGLSGVKFEDLNVNGAKDSGEPGIAGWTIKLMNGATEVAGTVTAADGSYSFAGVVPGSYTVQEDAQAAWTQSYPASPGTYPVTLVSGVDGPKDLDFGNWRKTSLSGMKFDDINGNGVKDSGEPGLPGWTIRLMNGATLVASTKTADDGSYSFADIVPGRYTVEEVAQDGWLQTRPASPGVYSLDLLSGIATTNIDFGNFKAGGFAGIKFEDKNGNGLRDSGEPGLPDWTIVLIKDGAEVASTVTASDGSYYFANVAPGSYTVKEKPQDGWTETSPAGDTYTAVSSSGQVKITRADQSEVPAIEANFGNRKLVEAFRVEIVADHQTVLPGENLVFTITINRVGDILLDSLSTQYTLPKGLKYVSANPIPQQIIENPDGSTTLIWTDIAFSSLLAAQLASSQDVSASPTDASALSTIITVNSEVQPDAPPILTGVVEVEGSTIEAEVDKAKDTVSVSVPSQPIYLNKTSDQKEVWPGGTIGYTINYQNLVSLPLTQVTITEQASSDLIFLSASPAPDQGTDNVWSIGDLAAHGKGTISVLFQVKNASNLSFLSQSSVSGSGFASTYRRLSTETQNQILKNSVTLTCKEFSPVSTSYFVKLRNSDGTSLLKTEHGSGEYSSEELASLQMQNRSISSTGSLKAVYRPTSFALPGGRSINYSSEISSLTRSRNRATQASTSNEIRYSKSLEMDERLLIDKNETSISVEGSLQGQAHLGVLKKDGQAVKPAPIFESSQDYTGAFRFNQSLEDYGGNVRLIGNASGQGKAASDQRLKKSQRSYEHGNGSYESEQQASTAESYLAKDLSVRSDPAYGYGKWQSGIWSKSSGKSYLGQQISGADYIKEETKASGLNDLSSNISYRGQGSFRTISEPDNRSALDLDEEYVGEYSIQRKVRLGGVSRFDRPHLTLNKTGRMEDGRAAADYTIAILNDGNTALGPVYVWDIFPAGTDYLGSSLKPTRLQPGYANWSLLYLGIGQSVTINLRLNVTDSQDELVNLVYASGGHNDEWVTAGNMSVIQFGWLGCCQPDLLLEKQARIDAADNRLIWYRILLQNRANVSLVAEVRDSLPTGLRILNTSAEPQVEGQDLVWVTTAIPAGESRFIEYRAQAVQNGKFVNTARVEAHALDGSGGASTEASATVTVGEATSYAEDGWKPPEWGLDRSEVICDDVIAGNGGSCSCPLSE